MSGLFGTKWPTLVFRPPPLEEDEGDEDSDDDPDDDKEQLETLTHFGGWTLVVGE